MISPVPTTNLVLNISLFITACINLSVISTDILAFVTFVKSFFISINSSKSGCSQLSDNIVAPLRPFCPIVSATCENVSIKLTVPVVYLALLLTTEPLGLRGFKLTPTPPP